MKYGAFELLSDEEDEALFTQLLFFLSVIPLIHVSRFTICRFVLLNVGASIISADTDLVYFPRVLTTLSLLLAESEATCLLGGFPPFRCSRRMEMTPLLRDGIQSLLRRRSPSSTVLRSWGPTLSCLSPGIHTPTMNQGPNSTIL